tara:strand:+ start:930 stop:2171 length:1242 start_codon:yes stop_codon:yes gene_type:complete
MTIDLLGLGSLSFVALITLYMAMKCKDLSRVLFIAFVVRILFLIINNNFKYLPDADMDGLIFEQRAWDWSQKGFFHLLDYYIGPDTYFLSFLIGIPYSLLGRSFLMAQSFSIFFGIGSVFLGWVIAKKLWGNTTAIKVAWVIALFPSLVSYSVLVMREVYITFFLLLAFYGIVNWYRLKNFKSFIWIVIGFGASTFFHGAFAIGFIIFLLIIIFESLKKTFKLLFAKRISINALIVTTFFSIILIFSVSNKINIPYIDFLKNLDEEELIININSKVRGEAAYPEWTKINSKSELIYKIPIRTIYFLFSPFPWKITKVEHTIGVLDAFLYTVLAYLIFLNRRTILKDPTLRTLLIIALFYCATFGLGVGNFGTAIRHRSKLVILLILLAAPLIPKLKFFIKKEIVEKIKKLKKA